MRVGSVYTRVLAGLPAVAIESAQTITVYTIVANNTAILAETVLLQEAVTGVIIQTLTVPANDTRQLTWPDGMLFHRGLVVTTPGSTAVTVYHTHGGS